MVTFWQSIRWRFIILITLVVILGYLATIFWSIKHIEVEADLAAVEKVKGDLRLGESLLNSWYPGEWAIKDGQLYKGDELMNGNISIIDEIGRLTGDTCTIFQGDIRVATNVKRQGQRAIGTKVSSEVSRVVLKDGQDFFGEAEVVGVKYQTAYKPIKDFTGKVIGMWYVGANKGFVDKMLQNVIYNVLLTFGLTLLPIIWIIWLLTNSFTHPVKELVEASNRLANGDLDTEIKVESQAEIDQLAQSFERMRKELKQKYSDLKTTNKLLEESERRFREMLGKIQLISVILDIDGNITFCNDYLLKITGWQRKEIIGLNWFDIFMPKEDRGQLKNNSGKVHQSILAIHGAREILTKTGELRLIFWNNTLLRDPQGKIIGSASIGEDITERKLIEERMQYLATHDSLTNIPNRYLLESTLKRAVAKAKRGQKSALLFIDLDNFKLVNDSMGHNAGDELLVSVVNMLRSKLREGDFIARLGGDEFAVLLEGSTLEEAKVVAEKLRKAVDETELCLVMYSNCFNLSLSIGVALVDGTLTSQQILSRADAALYMAKDGGRNRVVLLNEEEDFTRNLSETNKLIALIKNAFKENRFVLFFQPVVTVHDNQVIHYEALLRLRGKDGNLISPGEFIPIAERFGMMSQIDYWVTQAAMEALALYPGINIFINLSGVSLGDNELLNHIETGISRLGINPYRLGFEVTETTAVKDLLKAERWIYRLKEMGCRFALDDFGMGFSSFSYLRMLPVDYIKIDGTFINKLCNDPSNSAMVQAINTLSHTLGKKTIAEFVENEKILQKLKELNIDFGQGYYLGKPAPKPLPIKMDQTTI